MLQLETKRLYLKFSDKKLAPAVASYYHRNRDFFKPWDPPAGAFLYEAKYQKKVLMNEQWLMKRGESLRVWLFKKEEEGKIIGTASLTGIIRGAFHSGYLGYKLDKDELRKGYMEEALEKFIDFGFREYKLHRVEANIMPNNKASLSLIEKLGFQREGEAKDYIWICDGWKNHIHYVKINEDWKWEDQWHLPF